MKAGGESWSSGPIEAGTEALFTPDLITPSQYFDQRRTPADAGIRRLMLTVLEDGIRDFQRYRNNASTNHGRRIFWEAQRWIEAEGDLGPFCFDTLCETFNCDPQLSRERIYAGLLGILPRHSPPARQQHPSEIYVRQRRAPETRAERLARRERILKLEVRNRA